MPLSKFPDDLELCDLSISWRLTRFQEAKSPMDLEQGETPHFRNATGAAALRPTKGCTIDGWNPEPIESEMI